MVALRKARTLVAHGKILQSWSILGQSTEPRSHVAQQKRPRHRNVLRHRARTRPPPSSTTVARRQRDNEGAEFSASARPDGVALLQSFSDSV